MFPKHCLTFSLLSLFSYAYSASTTETPLMNEQQRQLFEDIKRVNMKIPSSQYDIFPEESEASDNTGAKFMPQDHFISKTEVDDKG